MVFVRLIALLFLVFYSYATGVSVSALSSGVSGKAMTVLFYVALVALYLLPVYEASKRRHSSIGPIALIDILLGWTVVGWIVALVWAIRKPELVKPSDENSPYEIVAEPSRYPEKSSAESLRELSRLRAEGTISEEEFDAAKGRVANAR